MGDESKPEKVDKIQFSNVKCNSDRNEEMIDKEVIVANLKDAGLTQYEPDVITLLSDYVSNYTTTLIDCALKFMNHAGRTSLEKKDVLAAISCYEKTVPKKLSYKELTNMAKEHNKSLLPKIASRHGIAIPNEGIVLKEPNYQMRSPMNPYQISFPLMDVSHRQNQMMASNAVKIHAAVGRPTMLRPLGHLPINLAPERIIVKPNIPKINLNNATNFNHNFK